MRRSFSIKIEPLGGTHIETACKDAIDIAGKLNCCIGFTFNGVDMFAYSNSDVDDMINRYNYQIGIREMMFDGK